MMRRSKKNIANRILLIMPVLLSCVGCDRITKSIAREGLANSGQVTFLNDIFRLQYAENPGAFLSLGAGLPQNVRFWGFIFFVSVFLAGMLVYLLASANISKAQMTSLSLVVGGGIGNLIDRIFNEGRVIDFMNIGIVSLRTGVFNVADIAISFGVVWLCAISFKTSKTKRPFNLLA